MNSISINKLFCLYKGQKLMSDELFFDEESAVKALKELKKDGLNEGIEVMNLSGFIESSASEVETKDNVGIPGVSFVESIGVMRAIDELNRLPLVNLKVEVFNILCGLVDEDLLRLVIFFRERLQVSLLRHIINDYLRVRYLNMTQAYSWNFEVNDRNLYLIAPGIGFETVKLKGLNGELKFKFDRKVIMDNPKMLTGIPCSIYILESYG